MPFASAARAAKVASAADAGLRASGAEIEAFTARVARSSADDMLARSEVLSGRPFVPPGATLEMEGRAAYNPLPAAIEARPLPAAPRVYEAANDDPVISSGNAGTLYQQIYAGSPELNALIQPEVRRLSPAEMERFAGRVGDSLEQSTGVNFKFVGDNEATPLGSHLTPVKRDIDGKVVFENTNYGSWDEAGDTVYFRRGMFEDPKQAIGEMRHETGAVYLGKVFGGKEEIPRADYGLKHNPWTTHDLDAYPFEGGAGQPIAAEMRRSVADLLDDGAPKRITPESVPIETVSPMPENPVPPENSPSYGAIVPAKEPTETHPIAEAQSESASPAFFDTPDRSKISLGVLGLLTWAGIENLPQGDSPAPNTVVPEKAHDAPVSASDIALREPAPRDRVYSPKDDIPASAPFAPSVYERANTQPPPGTHTTTPSSNRDAESENASAPNQPTNLLSRSLMGLMRELFGMASGRGNSGNISQDGRQIAQQSPAFNIQSVRPPQPISLAPSFTAPYATANIDGNKGMPTTSSARQQPLTWQRVVDRIFSVIRSF